VIEDDPDICELLECRSKARDMMLRPPRTAAAALELLKQGVAAPDLILADYNLPSGMDGLQATTLLRQTMRRPVPAIILTGDISTAALRNVALQDCIYLSSR